MQLGVQGAFSAFQAHFALHTCTRAVGATYFFWRLVMRVDENCVDGLISNGVNPNRLMNMSDLIDHVDSFRPGPSD